MCLPVGCLKTILSFFAFITIAIGVGGIILGGVELGKYGGFEFDEYNPNQVTAGIMLGFGIITFFVGITGLVGGLKKNKCCLCIYQFSVLPLLLIALIVASFATYSAVMAGDMADNQTALEACSYNMASCDKCGNKNSLKWVTEANTALYQVNTSLFGQTPSCKILAAPGDKQKYVDWGFSELFVTEDTTDKDAFTNALDCQIGGQEKQWGQFINFFEQEFKCSGMCAQTPFYAFYDTTIIPQNKPSCYKAVTDFFSNPAVTAISWSIFAYFLLNMVLACCLCCHPEQKKDKVGEPAYARMNYYQ